MNLQIQHLVDIIVSLLTFPWHVFVSSVLTLEIDLTPFHKPSLRNILAYWVLVLFLHHFLLYHLCTKCLLFTLYLLSFSCLQSTNTHSYNLSSSWNSCVFLSSPSVTMIVNPSYSTILILPVCLIYVHTFRVYICLYYFQLSVFFCTASIIFPLYFCAVKLLCASLHNFFVSYIQPD